MREVDRIVLDIAIHEDTAPSVLLDELFWAVMVRGLASGTTAWGRLFADIRGWSKGAGDAAKEDEERISDTEAAALVRGLIGGEDDD